MRDPHIFGNYMKFYLCVCAKNAFPCAYPRKNKFFLFSLLFNTKRTFTHMYEYLWYARVLNYFNISSLPCDAICVQTMKFILSWILIKFVRTHNRRSDNFYLIMNKKNVDMLCSKIGKFCMIQKTCNRRRI